MSENRLWSLQGSAWKKPTIYSLGEKSGLGDLVDIPMIGGPIKKSPSQQVGNQANVAGGLHR